MNADIRAEAQIRAAQLAHAAKQRREAEAVYRAQESAIRMKRNDYGITSPAYWGPDYEPNEREGG